MAVPWEIVISTAGGVAATVVGVFAGGVVGRRGQNEQWVRDNRTATYATFLREFVAVEIELRTAFLADRPHRLDWAPWNAALVALSLVATREVAAAAAELTGAVGRFAELVARSPKTREDLREVQEALDWQLGGPPAWAMTEPYAPESAAEGSA